MPDWPCTRCGAINLEGQRACEGCGRDRVGAKPMPQVPAPQTPRSVQPVTTWEQGQAAAKVLKAIVLREITVKEGRLRMAAALELDPAQLEDDGT